MALAMGIIGGRAWVFDFWSLVFGFWSLVLGLRFSVFGFWSLIFGVVRLLAKDQKPKTKDQSPFDLT
jgi:hypothetical protein